MLTVVSALAILGGACFAYCGVPAAIATVRAGKSVGTPISVAWAIFVGAIAMYGYLFLSYGFDLLIAINYVVEALSWGLIVSYHYFPRTSRD
jgi:hypothetical protein